MRDMLLNLLAPRPQKTPTLDVGATFYGDSVGRIVAPYIHSLLGDTLSFHPIVQRGDTANNMWRRLPYDTRFTNVVILQPGAYDISFEQDPLPALRHAVRYCQAEGRDVVLTGLAVRQDRPVFSINRQIEELAFDTGALWGNWQSIPGSWDCSHYLPDTTMARSLARLTVELIHRAMPKWLDTQPMGENTP